MLFATLLAAAMLHAQEPEGSLSGRILQAGDEAPLRNARVTVAVGQGKNLSVDADTNGRYTVRGIPPGQHRVVAAAPDREGRIGGFGPSAMRQVTLSAGEELSGFDFRVMVHGRVTGKVVDQNKEPVPGMRVVAVTREYHAGALRAVMTSGGTTDDLGEYVLERLEPGRAYVVMADRGGVKINAYSEAPVEQALRRPAFVPTFAPNSRTLDGGEPLVLRDGETREGVDVRVLRTQSFCMEGTIAGFGPRAYFSVGPRQPSSGTAGTTSSYHAIPGAVLPADGKIRVCDLPPGDYEVTVSESGAATFSAPVRFSTAAFSISDKDVTNVQIAAQAPVPLSGEVVWSGQPPDPPLEAKLRLFIQAVTRTNRASTASSLPGEFSFEGGVPVDDYKLDVNGVPDGVYVKDVAYGDRSVLLSTIRPGSGMAGAGVRVTLARDGGSVSVMVSDKDGNPVPECNVVLLPETAPSDAAAAAMLRTGKSDQRGRWSSGTVAPGKYVVLATTERIDRSPEAIAKVWKARVSGQTVEVKPGDKPTVKLAPRPL